jgi:glycine/sarcosine N-methyltransferase
MPESSDPVRGFYDPLAEYYHLIYADWDRAIEHQADVLNPLVASELGGGALKILDCACGIGTQALGFAGRGHTVVASDLSRSAVARAQREAHCRGLGIAFHIDDMTSLLDIGENDFDLVVALDNALPHLGSDRLAAALRAIYTKLKPEGLLMASIRDYDTLIEHRPAVQGPVFYGRSGERRIVHQVWDWTDREHYIVHLYITLETAAGWVGHHFGAEYRCLLREELTRALEEENFHAVRWLMPGESGYFQPLVVAHSGARPRVSR